MVSISSVEPMLVEECQAQENILYDKWILWAHLPHDTDWSLKSYNKIIELNSAERCNFLYEYCSSANGKKLYVIFDAKRHKSNMGRSLET